MGDPALKEVYGKHDPDSDAVVLSLGPSGKGMAIYLSGG